MSEKTPNLCLMLVWKSERGQHRGRRSFIEAAKGAYKLNYNSMLYFVVDQTVNIKGVCICVRHFVENIRKFSVAPRHLEQVLNEL